MIRHIVLYRLKEQDKEQNARTMKEKLEGLNGKIEGLHGLRIDRDCNTHQYDVCLTADFDDPAALQSYKKHPLHVAASDFVHEVMAERAGFDFEVSAPPVSTGMAGAASASFVLTRRYGGRGLRFIRADPPLRWARPPLHSC